MKILFINPYHPPWAPGGAEHSLEQMCMQFSQLGWDVEVLALAFDERALDERKAGYWVRWVIRPFSIEPGQNINAEDYFRTNQFRKLMLKRSCELERPDVVIANNAQVYEIAACLGRKFKVPTVGIVRDTQMLCEFGACIDNHSAKVATPCRGFLGSSLCSIQFQRIRGGIGWRPLLAWFWKGIQVHKHRMKLRTIVQQFDHIVTISEALNLLVRTTLPELTPNRVSTIRNFSTQVRPVSKNKVTEFLKQHKLVERKYFLFAGRKTYGKGVDLLVKATDIANKKSPQLKSLLLGRGVWGGETSNACIDVDSVPQSLLLGLLGQSAALIIPGRWQEGLHRTMIDAIFARIPVICSDAGAPPIDGVVEGCNGYIVPSNDSEALASAMIRVADWSSEQQEKCRIESDVRFRSHFATEKLTEQWQKMLADLEREKI